MIEEKKIKKNETIAAIITGIAVGVIVYGVVKNGFGFIYVFLPLILIYFNYKNSQKQKQILKQIQTEIEAKNSL
ncbi:MAG: hypothetical protein V4683_02760 [Bacteroidota bacterium]